MAWTDLARVKRFLAIDATDTTDDAVIADAIDAAQHLAFTARASSGYVDNPSVSPNAGATEGVTRWAALLYQSRGTGEGFAGFVDTGAVIGTPYYESRRTILLLLGVPRPTVDGVAAAETTPPVYTFAPFYYAKAKDVLNIPDTYTPVVSLAVADTEAGTYMTGLALSYRFPTTSRSVYIRWRVNGGAWVEFVHEPGDAADVLPLVYTFPTTYPGGVFTFDMEMRKGTTGAQLDCQYADVWAQRVG
jgi:hypothetical protein